MKARASSGGLAALGLTRAARRWRWTPRVLADPACRRATSHSRTSCAACSVRTRRSPTRRSSWPRTCAPRCASSCWPARPTSRSRSWWPRATGTSSSSGRASPRATPGCGSLPGVLLLVGALVLLCASCAANRAAGRRSRPRRRGPAPLMLTFVLLAAALTAAGGARRSRPVVAQFRRGSPRRPGRRWAPQAYWSSGRRCCT